MLRRLATMIGRSMCRCCFWPHAELAIRVSHAATRFRQGHATVALCKWQHEAQGMRHSIPADDWQPCRELGSQVRTVRASDVRPIGLRDLEQALGMIRPSVSRKQLAAYDAWTRDYGTV